MYLLKFGPVGAVLRVFTEQTIYCIMLCIMRIFAQIFLGKKKGVHYNYMWI